MRLTPTARALAGFACVALGCGVARAPTSPAAAAPAEDAASPAAIAPEPAPPPVESPASAPGAPGERVPWRHEFVSAPEAGTFAVVPVGAILRSHPRDDASRWEVDGWYPRVVRVLGEVDGFVEVELDWPEDPALTHCLLAPASPVGLRVFVREEVLEEVTSEPLTIETGGGFGVVAAPGVLVRRGVGGDGGVTLTARAHVQAINAWTSGSNVGVSVPGAPPAIGRYYAPVRSASLRAPLPPPAPYVDGIDRKSGYVVDHGSGTIALPRRIFAQAADDPTLVVVGAPCLIVGGRLQPVPQEGGAGGGCAIEILPWEEHWTVAAGTPLTWRRGGEAGRLYRKNTLRSAPRRRGKERCFVPRLGCTEAAALEVCAPASAFTHVPASEPPSWWHSPQPARGAAKRR